jgi:glycogen(starch) synthase
VRVLLISVGDEILARPSGTIGRRLASYADQAGTMVQIVYSPLGHRRRATRLSAHLVSYPTRSRTRIAFFVDALAAGRRILSSERFDLIETQDPAVSGVVGLALGRLYRVPCVVGCHTDLFASDAWARESLRNRLERFIARRVARQADGVRVVSSQIGRSVVELGVPKGRVGIAPVPVDEDLYRLGRERTALRRGWTSHGGSSRPTVPVREGRILFVGRLVASKDVGTLLTAVAALGRRGIRSHLTLAGDGPQAEPLRRAAAEHGLIDSVEFVGAVPPNHLSELYLDADVLVLPSKYEGYGRVIVEAALHGVPTIATAVGGIPELVKDGETGRLISPGDAQALAEALIELLGDPVQRDRLGRAAWDRAIVEFEPRRQREAIVAFWRRIAETGRLG